MTSLATNKQFYNLDDDTIDSCGRPAKTVSKAENLNADQVGQRLREGTRLQRQATFEPLDHNLLWMMAHVMFPATADAFADSAGHRSQQQEPR